MKKVLLLPLLASLFLLCAYSYPSLVSTNFSSSTAITIGINIESPMPFCSDSDDGCSGDVVLHFTLSNTCADTLLTVSGEVDLFDDGQFDETATITGAYPDYTVNGRFPIGNHRLSISISNNCGEEASSNIAFEVVDCTVPMPDCRPGFVVDVWERVSQEEMVIIYATELLNSDTLTDCSGILGYSIHNHREVMEGTDVPAYPHPGFVPVCCEDNTTVIVDIYVWDTAYNPYSIQPDSTIGGPNYNYCQAYVLLNGWDVACECFSQITVSGNIATPNNTPVEGVSVAFTGGAVGDFFTDSLGNYSWDGLYPNADETITPFLDETPMRGVSTLDLILISKHILGDKLLDSPYKMIAADVNNSGTISVLDLIQLRKLILGIYTEFPVNTSWRFVDASYQFPNGNPFSEPFPESISFNTLTIDQPHSDFIAVKIGDVNESAISQ